MKKFHQLFFPCSFSLEWLQTCNNKSGSLLVFVAKCVPLDSQTCHWTRPQRMFEVVGDVAALSKLSLAVHHQVDEWVFCARFKACLRTLVADGWIGLFSNCFRKLLSSFLCLHDSKWISDQYRRYQARLPAFCLVRMIWIQKHVFNRLVLNYGNEGSIDIRYLYEKMPKGDWLIYCRWETFREK